MKYTIIILVLFFNTLFGQWPLWANPSLPVGTANKGVGLDKGELLLGSNFSTEYIDWSHGALDNTGPHAGTLDSYISDININYGLTDRWNLEMNMIIGKRTMHFPQEANIHHRDESRLGIGDLGINLRHISSNISFGPGTRLFFRWWNHYPF